MLFSPQRDQRGLGPMPERTQAMHPGMARRAERDQESPFVDARAPMMDRELATGAAHLAAAAVTIENGIALATEPQAGMRLTPVAPNAKPGGVETVGTTRAEKPGLPSR